MKTIKVCSKCKIEKFLEEFYRDKSKKDDHRPDCKLCMDKYGKKNKESIRKYQAKYSTKYNQNNKEHQAKYYQNNKEKIYECQEKYRKNNKEKICKRVRKYNQTPQGRATIARAAHRRRELISSSKNFLDHNQWAIILFVQQYKCACCKEYFDKVKPTIDHIVPLSKGGDLIKENVQILCRSCNNQKYTKNIDYRTKVHKNIVRNLI